MDKGCSKKIQIFKENLLSKIQLTFNFESLIKFKNSRENLGKNEFPTGVKKKLNLYKRVVDKENQVDYFCGKENIYFSHWISNLNFWPDLAQILDDYAGDVASVVKGIEIFNRQLPAFVLLQDSSNEIKYLERIVVDSVRVKSEENGKSEIFFLMQFRNLSGVLENEEQKKIFRKNFGKNLENARTSNLQKRTQLLSKYGKEPVGKLNTPTKDRVKDEKYFMESSERRSSTRKINISSDLNISSFSKIKSDDKKNSKNETNILELFASKSENPMEESAYSLPEDHFYKFNSMKDDDEISRYLIVLKKMEKKSYFKIFLKKFLKIFYQEFKNDKKLKNFVLDENWLPNFFYSGDDIEINFLSYPSIDYLYLNKQNISLFEYFSNLPKKNSRKIRRRFCSSLAFYLLFGYFFGVKFENFCIRRDGEIQVNDFEIKLGEESHMKTEFIAMMGSKIHYFIKKFKRGFEIVLKKRKSIISILRIFLYKKDFKIVDEVESNQAYFSEIVARLYPNKSIRDDLIFEILGIDTLPKRNLLQKVFC